MTFGSPVQVIAHSGPACAGVARWLGKPADLADTLAHGGDVEAVAYVAGAIWPRQTHPVKPSPPRIRTSDEYQASRAVAGASVSSAA